MHRFFIVSIFIRYSIFIRCNFVETFLTMRNEEILKLVERITSNPEMLGGKPVIRGMRFPVADILELLASGMSHAQILEQHAGLEEDDIIAALSYAALRLKNTAILHAA